MASRLGDDDDVDEVVEELEEADLAPLDDIAVGPGRLPEVAAERRGGCPGEGAPPVGPTYALLASAALRREMMTQMRGP